VTTAATSQLTAHVETIEMRRATMATADREMETRSVRLLRLEADVILSCLEERHRFLRATAADPAISTARQMALAGNIRTVEEIVEKVERAMSK
jgi:hypothetical protein